jgi:DNA-binding NtrC family response regulator
VDPAILYVDDERENLAVFRRHFDEEFRLLTATSAAEALGMLSAEAGAGRGIGVVVSDERMPGMTGTDLLAEVERRWPTIGRILLTAYSDRELLLAAIQRGHVHDYVLKGWDGRDLGLRLRRALDAHRQARALEQGAAESETLREEVEELRERAGVSGLVGLKGGLLPIAETLARIAQTDSTVMIRGESGTGKELIARELHQRSPRARGPFVRVNCAALAEGVLESELFGHEAGSFTGAKKRRLGRFEQAHGGTLFLDEIGDISAAVQVKLLRVLEERELERVGGNETIPVDVRVVSATNRDLERLVREGRFREDAFYRLNVVPLHLPPLRDRPQDIEPLAHHFLGRYAQDMGKRLTLAPAALDSLRQHDWPGNVRELRNVIERAAAVADLDAVLLEDDLLFDFSAPAHPATGGTGILGATGPSSSSAGGPPPPASIFEQIAREEAERISEALRKSGGSRARAARLLGLPRTTLNDKIRRLGLA